MTRTYMPRTKAIDALPARLSNLVASNTNAWWIILLIHPGKKSTRAQKAAPASQQDEATNLDVPKLFVFDRDGGVEDS